MSNKRKEEVWGVRGAEELPCSQTQRGMWHRRLGLTFRTLFSVTYLSYAAKCDGPLPSCLRVVPISQHEVGALERLEGQ
jgi:hypothetical protein